MLVVNYNSETSLIQAHVNRPHCLHQPSCQVPKVTHILELIFLFRPPLQPSQNSWSQGAGRIREVPPVCANPYSGICFHVISTQKFGTCIEYLENFACRSFGQHLREPRVLTNCTHTHTFRHTSMYMHLHI